MSARRILAGLFGGVSTGLRGYAARKGEERDEMRREREILSEREFQREMDTTRAARDREREDRLRQEREETRRLAEEDNIRSMLIDGKVIREPDSVSERLGTEMPTIEMPALGDGAARLEESLTGAPRAGFGPGIGLQPNLIEGQPRRAGEDYVRGSTGLGLDAGAVLGRMEQEGPTLGEVFGRDGTSQVRPSQAFNPLSIEVPDFELQRADPRTQPQRELIEMGGGIFSIPTNQEIAARQREANRGFDEIELNELQAAALGEGTEARDAQRRLANADIDYLTPREREDRVAAVRAGELAETRRLSEVGRMKGALATMINNYRSEFGSAPDSPTIARMAASLKEGDEALNQLLTPEDMENIVAGGVAQDEASQGEGEDAVDPFPDVVGGDLEVDREEYEKAKKNVADLEQYFEPAEEQVGRRLARTPYATALSETLQLDRQRVRRLRDDLSSAELSALKISPLSSEENRQEILNLWRNSLDTIRTYEETFPPQPQFPPA